MALLSGLLALLSAAVFSNNYVCAWIGAAVTVTAAVAFAGALVGELPERWQARGRRVRIIAASALAIGTSFVPPFHLSPVRAFDLATEHAAPPTGMALQSVRCTYLGGPGDYELLIRFTATADAIGSLTRAPWCCERFEVSDGGMDRGDRMKTFQMTNAGQYRSVLPTEASKWKRPRYYFIERDDAFIRARDTLLIWDESTLGGMIVHSVG